MELVGVCVLLFFWGEGGGKWRMWESVPSRSYEVFGLDLAGAHLSVLGALLDVLHELLLLVLELDTLTIELALRLLEGALVLA